MIEIAKQVQHRPEADVLRDSLPPHAEAAFGAATVKRQRQIGGQAPSLRTSYVPGEVSGRELKPSPPTTEPCSAAVVVALPVPASSRMAHGPHQQQA
jgi:hypothetical protein